MPSFRDWQFMITGFVMRVLKNISKKLNHLLGRQDGVTAIEYALIAALIALVIIVAVTAIGTNLSGTFNFIATSI